MAGVKPGPSRKSILPKWLEPGICAARPTAGTFRCKESFRINPEFFMQAVVDRVMRAFTLKHPISDEEAETVRKEAAAFAAELLEKYKDQLARRTLSGAER
jgi:hypothetical protein